MQVKRPRFYTLATSLQVHLM